MRKNEKITALYERLSRDDFGKDDDQQRESNSISNQELGTVKNYAQIRLQVWQNKVCTGQEKLPLITR